MLPAAGDEPKYSQMYIFDTANEVKNRVKSVTRTESSTSLDEETVSGLMEMLDSTSALTKIYRAARDRYELHKPTELSIRLVAQRHRGKQYDLPTSDEIAGLIVGDLSSTTGGRDVIVHLQSDDLQRITELHPLYMALQYPLLFPYGEDGYHPDIPYASRTHRKAIKREFVTMLEFYAYQIQTRLLQGDSDAIKVGCRIILPSSFTGGPRYMAQNYQDAMAICRTFGNPDLFITMTANPNWEEIKEHLQCCGNFMPNDRPDLESLVFKMKLEALVADLWDGDFFGEAKSRQKPVRNNNTNAPKIHIAVVYTIEFQKRGLPHAHILVWLRDDMRNPTNTDIDKIISAEIPDENNDPEGYQLVEQFMTHGPCGKDNPNLGVDKATIVVGRKKGTTGEAGCSNQNIEDIDEIRKYQECCYLSACEAMWRIFAFDIHYSKPVVQRLTLHLRDQQPVTYSADQSLDSVISRPGIDITMFTEWMKMNETDPFARTLTYAQFPLWYVWNTTPKTWTRRKQGHTIGRIVNIHPTVGELYYLRLLLGAVTGPTSYDDILTVDGIIYDDFKGACLARGMLDGDKGWVEALEETRQWGFPCQLRSLFVTLLIYSYVSSPLNLWNHSWLYMAEDIEHTQRQKLKLTKLHLTEEQLKNYTLLEIEKILQQHDKTLSDFPDMPMPDKELMKELNNSYLMEEKGYDKDEQQTEHDRLFVSLNDEQRLVFHAVMDSIENGDGRFFFLNGPGGLALQLCFSQEGAQPTQGSMLAELLRKTDLIIWDEAPMTHRFAFEAVDRSLRDLLAEDDPKAMHKLFGGRGGEDGITWWRFQTNLTRYIRRQSSRHGLSNNKQIIYVGFIGYFKLRTEQRQKKKNRDSYDEVDDIKINGKLLLQNGEKQIAQLATDVYPDFKTSYLDREYITKRAILTPKNDTAHELNMFLQDKIPGDAKEYLSANSIEMDGDSNDSDELLYPAEFLNSLKISGLRDHCLKLKIGSPVMLIRNLNQKEGICNGTRLIVTRLGTRVIEAEILTGTTVGNKVVIPRIILSPPDQKWPFKLKRRQFPLRLSYAMTINKSQGQSLEQVGIYLPKPIFSHGQLYVTLSRVTSEGGLKVLNMEEEATHTIKNIVYKEVFNNATTYR
ncbi:PREDICTED: uncharacterized protein LOC104720511 [Camelina sativa]|uniref:ATP-dependent DNA helicase n=1 Tax=Camelina sativa TaxID=90675 RepID=A0ABM1QHS7_CAMSA|nr:PREDICTED: uncharacterized protein LOC104720511 [Camelina sativa]